jgi:hypothetical protein
VRLVNAAYTSQVIPGAGFLGKRVGDRLYCPHGGRVVWHAEDAVAITILDRAADADIGLYTRHRRVEQIIQDRAIAHGADCRTRTPPPQVTAGVESETSNPDQHRSRNRKQVRIPRYPAYASQAWVSTLNPGEVTAVQARSLLTDAHAGGARRHRPRV